MLTIILHVARPGRQPRAGPAGPGDALFLMLVGASTTLAMHSVHRTVLTYALAVLVGMAVAMFTERLLALAAGPILRSTKSRGASMLVAMLGPMIVCATDFLGHDAGTPAILGAGAALGLGVFVASRVRGRIDRTRAPRPAGRSGPGTPREQDREEGKPCGQDSA